jgi:hypothetical protein
MVDRLVVEFEFEVSEAQVVVELGVVVAEGLCLVEGLDRVLIVA